MSGSKRANLAGPNSMDKRRQSSLLSFFQRGSPNTTCEKQRSAAKRPREHSDDGADVVVVSAKVSPTEQQLTADKAVSDGKVSPSAKENVKAGDSAVVEKGSNSKKKRRRVVVSSDSEEEESATTREPNNASPQVRFALARSTNDEDSLSDLKRKGNANILTSTPLGGRKKGGGVSSASKLHHSSASILLQDQSYRSEAEQSSFLTTVDEGGSASRFKHLEFDFLKPEKIRDKNRRRPTDPNYDPKTLYVPEDFLKTQTPAVRQWWQFKSDYFDVILFFKVGKFYELYHMDAVVGVQQLNLTYMKGGFAHSGFPETAFGRFSDQLVQRGYRVARVEQTETPQQLDVRNQATKRRSSSARADKVVRREVCQITSAGTRTFGVLDGVAGDSNDDCNRFLLAIKEEMRSDDTSFYGVAFVDCSVGAFHVGQFEDDIQGSHLRTLLARFAPSQVLLERGKLSSTSQQLVRTLIPPSVTREFLISTREFLTAESTLKLLSDYWGTGDEKVSYPEVVLKMTAEEDALHLTPLKNYRLALSAFGALIWYLKRCLVESDLLSMSNVSVYESSVGLRSGQDMMRWWAGERRMVLDGITLRNLNILADSADESAAYSLLATVGHCSTTFGRRLLSQWLCSPLCDPQRIRRRQEAVRFFYNADLDYVEKTVRLLRELPDLERLLQKIHTLGSKKRATDHPDGRAVMFEEEKYNKKKLADLLSALAGFEKAASISTLYEKQAAERTHERSQLLDEQMSAAHFPDLSECLSYVRRSFDLERAKKDGVVLPTAGADEDYDRAVTHLKEIQSRLEDCLNKERERLRCSRLTFVGTGRTRYQLEVPDEVVHKLTNDYEFRGQRKGFKRYMTVEIERCFAELQDAENERDAVMRDIMRRVFAKFDLKYSTWTSAVGKVALFDVVLSFGRYARNVDGDVCLADVMEPRNEHDRHLEIKDGIHPCLSRHFAPGDYIPNDTTVSSREAPLLLLTGPNMGGKSTLMRQVALISILGQLGSYVPAKSCVLTPIDRIFTRLGAADRIGAGQSTFFVELSETNSILRDASEASLVILDELGRGTSTFDGTAVAHAVLRELSENIGCRTLFSTHYHSLVDDFDGKGNVALKHMASLVENENQEDPTEEVVTFLYKMVAGVCPKSYGFYAAKLAGIPLQVVREAHRRSKELTKQRSSGHVSSRLSLVQQRLEHCLSNDEVASDELQSVISAIENL